MLRILGLKKDRKLGVAERKGRYDLPLNQSAGTGFLVLLIGLMTFLAMMTLTANFMLGGLTSRWTSGLEKVLTIEIPAARKDSTPRSVNEIDTIEKSVEVMLKNNPNVQSVKILENQEITALVSPWLGDDVVLDEIPLPGLISVEVSTKDPSNVKKIENALKDIQPDIRIDTHDEWLDDILRLAGSLKFSAILVTLVIGLTTIVAVAGGIRSRLAEHHADIELLHLMGADDYYITRQFQRHALIMGLKGSVAGAVLGMAVLIVTAILSRSGADSIVPGFSIGAIEFAGLAILPLVICAISALTARFTVLRTLARMP
jgi:cell division transport system permease protein